MNDVAASLHCCVFEKLFAFSERAVFEPCSCPSPTLTASFHLSVYLYSSCFITMPLYLIGLGLGDERDITLRGVEAIKKCSKIFLESYTSVLCVGAEKLVSSTC